MRIDIKHGDAVLALREVIRGPRDVAVRPGPPPTVWSERWRQRWAPPTPVAVTPEAATTSSTSLTSRCFRCSAYAPPTAGPTVRPWNKWPPGTGLDPSRREGSVRHRASRAVADVRLDDYERALENLNCPPLRGSAGNHRCVRLSRRRRVALAYRRREPDVRQRPDPGLGAIDHPYPVLRPVTTSNPALPRTAA